MAERRKDSKNRVLKANEYERKDGMYEYKWRDRRGKRYSVYCATLEGLREKEAEITLNILSGKKSKTVNCTLNEVYNRWLAIKRGLKANTLANYRYMYTQFVENDIGEMKIRDIKHSDIRAFYNTLLDERRLKIQTIDTINNVLHQVFQLAVDDEMIRNNPVNKAFSELKKAHNQDVPKRHALTKAEQELLEGYMLKKNKYRHWYPIIAVMLWTGMRVGEVTGLRWCDVNFKKNEISVNHTLVYYSKGKSEGMTYTINTPKTKAGKRIIPMLPKVKEALLMEKQHQKDCEISCNVSVDGYTDFIFINAFGGLLNQATLNKALRRVIRDCNYDVIDGKYSSDVTLPPFSNHVLRHTFATRMCEAGMNLKAMQDILGHSDAETTLNIYTEATREFKHTEVERLADFFNENENT